MAKKLFSILVFVFVLSLVNVVCAEEYDEEITENEIYVISEECTGTTTIKKSLVDLDEQRFIKIHTIRNLGKNIAEHFVRYVDPNTARIERVIRWQVQNGKIVFPKGKKKVKIETKK